MRDLIHEPLWQPSDLGVPIPCSPHAVSVCLPTWRDNVGYEEQDPRVHQKLTTGYPRFVYNGLCRELFQVARARFGRDDEACLAFPAGSVAERFAGWLRDRTGDPVRVHEFGMHDVHAVVFPERHARLAKSRWQHCGEGLSSRHAEACLSGRNAPCGRAAEQAIREGVARTSGANAEDVFLFPCGMNAIYALFRVLSGLFPDRRSVQFGFPYVDTLKIQQKLGGGVYFFPRGDADELQQVRAIAEREPLSGLYTEFPSNPLLASPDLESLGAIVRRHGFPLIVDDTVATSVNVDVLQAADIVCTSLTKFFSGVGDVTAGALVLNHRSPLYSDLSSGLRGESDHKLWSEDAIALEANSRDYEQRTREINERAAKLADYLSQHPRVERVYHPSLNGIGSYDAFRRSSGGYGGLLSLTLRDGAAAAPRFFDALRISKGPNLGMNYSLACPYTILAHYDELDFAESCGVSPFLVRVSVGLEEPQDLIDRFERALRS